MSTTIWIHTLEGRNYSKDSEDHSLMNRYSDPLDALCDSAGVGKLSDFMDYTDLEYSYPEEEEEEEAVIDPETGVGYGIDDMEWFDAAAGLLTLKTLRGQVAAAGIPGPNADQTVWLVEELDHCIALLEGPAARGGKFHLAIIG
jgi:hypothetical protein